MEQLSPEVQSVLRENQRMNENEVAYVAGDLVVIVNVVDNSRRVLGKMSEVISENRRRVLKG